MSNRVAGAANGGSGSYKNDDERRREEARSSTLQGQVDELRQALRELASRQVRLEESIKSAEGSTVQNRLLLDQMRQESQQSFQARALDENRTRQYLGELEQRLDDSLRPLRSLQAHVGELLEGSRRKADDSGQHLRRFEEIKVQLEQQQAVGDRNLVINSQLRDALDGVRNDVETQRRDSLRHDDSVKIVDQESRRRNVEITQAQQEANVRIDDLRSDIAHAGDLIDELKRSYAHVDPAIKELHVVDTDAKNELARFSQQSTERHDLVVERVDDLRHTTDGQIAEARQAAEVRFERLSERLDELSELDRDVGLRVSGIAHLIEELRLADEAIRRDIWQLHEQRVRLRVEQAQQELEHVTGQRRHTQTAVEAPVTDQAIIRPADR